MSENLTVPAAVKQEPDPWAPADWTQNQYPGPGKPPIVSIILPAYNAHNTIKKTIASIAMQEGSEDIEIIIADDCSKYDYNKIAEQFKHMIRIRVVKMLKNGGPGAARQVGFDYSYGQYIMWMDADDTLVAADTIKTLVNVMEQQHMDCVYGKFLEENENGAIYPHEVHMVWMFGKLYRRSFIERYNIRFNTSLSNEDTGFNCVVKGCSDKIWYIPKDVYIWHYKANSITRIKQGMYGQDSGYKGWIDNMVWQIKELEKRFVNRNYILSEIIGNMVTAYCFHEENLRNYPMNAEISLNWCRGFYHAVYEPNEKYISQALFDQLAAQCLASHNISSKGIIPSMSLKQFMREMKKPIEHLPNEETCGATPAGYIPPITSEDWPVEITDFYDGLEPPLDVDSDTNHSRYGGMKKAIGVPLSEEDYDMEYDGSQPLKEEKKEEEVDDRPPWEIPIEERFPIQICQYYRKNAAGELYDTRNGMAIPADEITYMTGITRFVKGGFFDGGDRFHRYSDGKIYDCTNGLTIEGFTIQEIIEGNTALNDPDIDDVTGEKILSDVQTAAEDKPSEIYQDVKLNEGKKEPADMTGENGAPETTYESAINNTTVHRKFNRSFRP